MMRSPSLLALAALLVSCGSNDDDGPAGDADADADADADGDTDADADTDTDGDADPPECPAAVPEEGRPCEALGAICTFQDCGGPGVTTAQCFTEGIPGGDESYEWHLSTETCGTFGCGEETCDPGQICVSRASGALLQQCVENPCGTDALTCTCAGSLCAEGDECSTTGLWVMCDSGCRKCP